MLHFFSLHTQLTPLNWILEIDFIIYCQGYFYICSAYPKEICSICQYKWRAESTNLHTAEVKPRVSDS